jgi:hypothetical protein
VRRSLSLVTGPAVEPVTLDEVKAWARVDTTDEDGLLTALIGASRQAVEDYLRRSLITQSWKLTLDAPCSGLADYLSEGVYDLPVSALNGAYPRRYELPKGPVQSITSFVTYSTANASSTLADTNYFLDDSRLVLNDTAMLPTDVRSAKGIEITYVTGYGSDAGSVPQAIRTALLMTTAVMYETRGACDSADIPAGAKRLVNAYRVRDELLNA